MAGGNPTGKGGFGKGKSGNPGGKSKKVKEIEELARKTLQKGTRNEAMTRLSTIMMQGEDKDSIAAAKILLGYAYGNPRQRTELSGPDDSPIELVQIVRLPDNGRK